MDLEKSPTPGVKDTEKEIERLETWINYLQFKKIFMKEELRQRIKKTIDHRKEAVIQSALRRAESEKRRILQERGSVLNTH